MATKIKKTPMDCETGGVTIGYHSLLTLYMCVLSDEGQITDELDLKTKPDNGILICDQQALDVNGIDPVAHVNDPNIITYTEARARVIDFCKRNMSGKKSLRPAGHNIATFDIPFIQSALGISQSEWGEYFHYRIVDTMPLVTAFQDAGWLPDDVVGQESLVKYYNVAPRKAHVAKNDVLMWIDAYQAMIRTMIERKSGNAGTDEILILE
jgi:hypothetical protein